MINQLEIYIEQNKFVKCRMFECSNRNNNNGTRESPKFSTEFSSNRMEFELDWTYRVAARLLVRGRFLLEFSKFSTRLIIVIYKLELLSDSRCNLQHSLKIGIIDTNNGIRTGHSRSLVARKSSEMMEIICCGCELATSSLTISARSIG